MIEDDLDLLPIYETKVRSAVGFRDVSTAIGSGGTSLGPDASERMRQPSRFKMVSCMHAKADCDSSVTFEAR